MAGIYIHIPFCKKRCNYCDFYKTTNIKIKNDFLSALLVEIERRSNFLVQNKISTIYFGGGTPSVLSPDELNSIFQKLGKYFSISDVAEITLEVNPDDFTDEWGRGVVLSTPVNRLSFGLQSIFDSQLRVMGRRHNSLEGLSAVKRAFNIGFENVTADLIYGLPGLSLEMWLETLDQVLDLPIKHLSAYHLTFEEGTPFYTDLKKGFIKEVDDDISLKQFEMLLDKASERGFLNYEISNFALPGYESLHNSNYWSGEPYLGLGPSAHSFYMNERCWNVADVKSYIEKINSNQVYYECESLSADDRFNELVMLGLRTSKGVSLTKIESLGQKYYDYFMSASENQFLKGELISDNQFVKVSPKSKFLTDGIIQSLFIV